MYRPSDPCSVLLTRTTSRRKQPHHTHTRNSRRRGFARSLVRSSGRLHDTRIVFSNTGRKWAVSLTLLRVQRSKIPKVRGRQVGRDQPWSMKLNIGEQVQIFNQVWCMISELSASLLRVSNRSFLCSRLHGLNEVKPSLRYHLDARNKSKRARPHTLE